jgi:hypothetical protein
VLLHRWVVLDDGVRTREEEPFVPVLCPSDQVGGTTIDAPDVQDQRMALRFTNVMPRNGDSVPGRGSHCVGLLLLVTSTGVRRFYGDGMRAHRRPPNLAGREFGRSVYVSAPQ